MAMSYFNAFELPLTIARPFKIYGPRQSAHVGFHPLIHKLPMEPR